MSAFGAGKSDGFETLWLEAEGLRGRVAELEAAAGQRLKIEENVLRLAQIVESSEDAIIGKTLAGIVETWNHGAERVYGYCAKEMTGRPMSLLLPPDRPDEESEVLRRLRAGERIEHFETVRMRKDGRRIHVSLTISPILNRYGAIIGASHIARDISERKEFEERLRQTQKLESLGVLAGGIAHDFNNLLTGILGNTSLAVESLPPSSPNRNLLSNVMQAAERAAGLTRQLLAYAGKGRFVTEHLDLSEIVRETTNLIQASIPRHVLLRLDLGQGLRPIEADAGQVQQVVMNLVINAAEAIEHGNGMVIVSTYPQEVDENYRRSLDNADLATGSYVVLEVHDNGCGMDEASIPKIFDPFYTTKFAGRGLGLAAVMGIVRGHKGALRVYSDPGEGTTFKVLLPTVGDWREREPKAAAVETLHGTGTVLVVDDEDIVRTTARNALERYGYTVLTASDGREAVEIFRRHAGEIDVVLLDLTMPVMGGEEALRNFQAVKPAVKVLLSSGFDEVEATRHFTGKGLAGFIQKPYAALKLVERINSVLK
jgi:PAS domain S-box-containing protein